MNNLERQRQYKEKYKREFPYYWFRYCREPLELIEGWDDMLNDTTDKHWHLHHIDEIQDDKVISKDELKSRGEYYKLPANKLIFLTKSEHHFIHNTGKTISKETKKKMSEAKKGDKCWLSRRTGADHPRSKKIEVEGVPFVSITSAAEKFDKHPTTILNWLKSGKAKYL